MDRQLREYAQARRREAAIGELHPATRRLLQAEVARVYGQPRATRAPRRLDWNRLWFRVAFAGGGLAVLLLAGTVWVSLMARPREPRPLPQPGEERTHNAPPLQSSPMPDEPSPQRSAFASTEPFAADTGANLRSAERGMAGREIIAGGQSTGPLAAPASKAAAVEETDPLPAADTASAGQSAAGAAPVAAVALTASDFGRKKASRAEAETLAKETSLRLTEATAGQHVEGRERVARSKGAAESPAEAVVGLAEARGAAPTAEDAAIQAAATRNGTAGTPVAFFKNEAPTRGDLTVLNTFSLVQNGEELRLIDGDGSIYVGKVAAGVASPARSAGETALPFAVAQSPRPSPPAAAAANPPRYAGTSQAGQVYTFTARGTNLTLNQLVVVQGHYLVGSLPVRSADGVGQEGSPGQRRITFGASPAEAARQSPPASVSLVQGQATIGGSNTILIRAVPAAP